MLVGAGVMSVLFLPSAHAGAQEPAQSTGSGADVPLLLLGLAAAVLLGCWL